VCHDAAMSWVEVLLGAVRLAALASFVYLIWFTHKGLRNQRREAAANPDPQRKRRSAQTLTGLLAYCMTAVVAFFVGRDLWGTKGGVAFAIGVFVVVWLAMFPIVIWQARKETRSNAERGE